MIGLTLIAWTVRAVNFLDLIVESGYSVSTYFQYSFLNLFGILPYSVQNWPIPDFFQLGIWPIVMGITMWLQFRLNPTPPDPVQARIFAWMPVIFTFLLATFPAGLVIYWTINNLLSIGQQWLIMKQTNKPK